MKSIRYSLLIAILVLASAACKFNSTTDLSSKNEAEKSREELLAQAPTAPDKPFVNLVTVRIKPDLLDEFLNVLKDYAAKTRREPGVIAYTVHQSPNDPSVIVLYEFYKNPAAREKHNQTKHRNAFFATVREKGYFAVPAVSVTLYPIDTTDSSGSSDSSDTGQNINKTEKSGSGD